MDGDHPIERHEEVMNAVVPRVFAALVAQRVAACIATTPERPSTVPST